MGDVEKVLKKIRLHTASDLISMMAKVYSDEVSEDYVNGYTDATNALTAVIESIEEGLNTND